MANIKFSNFTAFASNPIDASSGLVAYKGTDNIQFTPAELAPFTGLYAANGTLASNRTITMGGNTLSLDQTGSFNHTVVFSGLTNAGMAITGSGNYIVSSDGSYSINSTTNGNVDAISLQTSNNSGSDASILINSRSGDANADLHLKTATKLKISLPTAPVVGYVLKADDIAGNVSWAAQTDTGVTGVTLSIGTGATAPLAESITSRELTITSNKYGGTNQVGYVPEGGTSTTFLRGDGTWVTPTDTTDNAAGTVGQLQYTTGSGVFAATSDMVYTTDQLKVQNSIYLDGNGSSAGIVKLGCDLAGASHYIGLEGPNHSGNTQYNIKFPDATPSANRMLIANSMTGTTANMVWRDMYDANGTLTGARTVTMGTHNLTFAGSGTSKVTFSNLGGVQFDEDVTFVKNSIIQGQAYTELNSLSNTLTVNWNNSNVQAISGLTGSHTFTPTNPKAGATYILTLVQTGAVTATWGSYIKWAAPDSAATPPELSGAGKTDVITLICWSATANSGAGGYYGSITKDLS